MALSLVLASPSSGGFLENYWPLAAPGGVVLLLTRLTKWERARHILPGEFPRTLLVTGATLIALALSRPDPAGGLAFAGPLWLFATSLGLALLTTGTLLTMTRIEAPPGLVVPHPRAASPDALFALVASWTVVCVGSLARLLFPSYSPLPPLALDSAFLFACLGSQILLLVAAGRMYVLRGLELGTVDRTRASFVFLLAGLLTSVPAAWLEVDAVDVIVTLVLSGVCLSVGAIFSVAHAARVTRAVRGVLVLSLLGTPLSIALSTWAMHNPDRTPVVMGITFALAVLLGIAVRVLSTPFAPARGRWLEASAQATERALDPDPEQAIEGVLFELRKGEPTARIRPEIYVASPPAVLSVDTGGYLVRRSGEYPRLMHSTARDEPYGILRKETVRGVEVRRPEVRPLLEWFEAHEASAVVALDDQDGPVGLLVLPEGERRAHLSHEEALAFGRLKRRLSGVVASQSALERSQARELLIQQTAERVEQEATKLRREIERQEIEGRRTVDQALEVLLVAGNSPRALATKLELDQLDSAWLVELSTPSGVDPRPWAAWSARERNSTFVEVDLTRDTERSIWRVDRTSAARALLERAKQGTLLVSGIGALSREDKDQLVEALEFSKHSDAVHGQRLFFAVPRDTNDSDLLDPIHVERTIRLPALAERGEDLQPLILYELTRLGLHLRGRPLGISRPTLHTLLDRPFPGNEAELFGLLAALSAFTTGDIIHAVLEQEHLSALTSFDVPERRRAQRAPRSRQD